MSEMETKKLAIKRNDRIGHNAAEEDHEILNMCFVDNEGEIDVLKNEGNPRCIVLGRTGAGKTALLIRLEEQVEHSIRIKPENLAIEHVANSTILRFLTDDLGVRLDVFFKLLWRHAIAVEVIRERFNITSREKSREFFGRVKQFFRTEEDLEALEYIRSFGSSFWQETDARIKEVTTKVEESFESDIGLTAAEMASVRIGESGSFSEERKKEISQRAYQVIGKVQAKRLSDIVRVVDNVLDDSQKVFYISIDKLDENWIEDNLRYKLIRALIETIRDFNNEVYSLKINVALRLDLIKRVYNATTDPGFQEEKYESLYVAIEWSKERLTKLLNARINYLFKSKYTGQDVSYKDVLPEKVGNERSIDYLIDRTLLRPRDLIAFFNTCVQHVSREGVITADIIRQAELSYSESRFKSLQDEWRSDYPHLLEFSTILRGKDREIFISDIDKNSLEDLCLKVVTMHNLYSDEIPEHSISQEAKQFIENKISYEQFRIAMILVFFRIGLIGILGKSYDNYRWATSYSSSVFELDIEYDSLLTIHPAFHKAMGIK